MRFVLFDIDGTILYAGKAPAKALIQAMEEVFEEKDLIPSRGRYSFAGKTDPEIVTDLLRRKGYSTQEVQDRLGPVFQRYVRYLKGFMANGDDAHLHPGVMPLIQRLSAEQGLVTGILTGNIEEGARIKLDYFGLTGYFSVGVYGSDSPDRNQLPRILLEKVKKITGSSYHGEDMVVVGDSIYDIRCARTVGARVVAVTTGTTAKDELLIERPDYLFPDLSRTDQVLEAIMS